MDRGGGGGVDGRGVRGQEVGVAPMVICKWKCGEYALHGMMRGSQPWKGSQSYNRYSIVYGLVNRCMDVGRSLTPQNSLTPPVSSGLT